MQWADRIGRRIKLRDLHVLIAVVQSGSMTKAAQGLAISVPVISKAISDLEYTLGVRILDRSAQGVEPTIYGSALLKRSVAVFDELKQSVRDIEFLADPTVGELRIGYTESLSTTILPEIISLFSRKYPRVNMLLDDVSARAAETLGPGLRDRKYDCVLQRIVTPLPHEHFGDDLNAEVLFEDELVVVAGSNTQWAGRRKVELSELVDENPDHHRQIAALPHMPGDRRMHPHLEQDERRDGGVEIEWIEIAVPDPAHRVGREEEDTPGDEQEQHGCPDQRLDTDQFAAQHLLHERALEIGGDCRSLLASSAPPTSHWFPSSFRGASKRRTMGRPCAPENLEIPGSMLRIAPE